MDQPSGINAPMDLRPLSTDQPKAKEVRIVSSLAAIIMETANHDTIVVHSPGPMKTLITLHTISHVGFPAIFIVPASVGVMQSAEALREHAKAMKNGRKMDIQHFCGNTQISGSFDVLVTTPTAFDTARTEYGLDFLHWRRIKCIVFDEIHSVVKHHPYRKIVLDMRQSHLQPRVLALSQVWGGGNNREVYKRTIDSVSNDLKVDRIRVVLDNAGCERLADRGPPCLSILNVTPVTPQIHPCSENKAGPPNEKKLGPPLPTFLSRVETRSASPLCCALTRCVLLMESTLSERDETFSGCVLEGKAVKDWTVQAYEEKFMRIKEKHNLVPLYSQLEYWYEALRQLVISREQDVFLAVLYLRMFCCDTGHAKKIWPPSVQREVTKFWTLAPTNFPRLDRLRDVLVEKLSHPRSVRGHLLVKQMVTAHVLEYFISNDSKLCSYFFPACLYAPAKTPSGTFSMSKTQFAKNLEMFATGSVNILITTNVSMAGLQLSRGDWVIMFDDIETSEDEVGSGDANANPHATGAMNTVTEAQPDLSPSAKLQNMDSLISAYTAPLDVLDFQKAGIDQKQFEESASQSLFAGYLTMRNVLFKLNIFCRSTNIVLQETSQKVMDYHFTTSLTYKSALREVTGYACGPSKKTSRRLAALVLVNNLRCQLNGDGVTSWTQQRDSRETSCSGAC